MEETHDSYFQAAVSKGKAHYRCLVLDCPATFSSDHDRLKHLKEDIQHSYPKWFRFHSNVGIPNPPRGQSKLSRTQEKKKQWWDQKRMTFGVCVPVNSDASSDKVMDDSASNDKENVIMTRMGSESNDGETNETLQRKRKERKERKRRVNATIPCRFYHSKGGCWRGDKCMFLHSDDHVIIKEQKTNIEQNGNSCAKNNQDEGGEMDIDMIEDLSNQIRTKAKVSVPNKISFGRRRR